MDQDKHMGSVLVVDDEDTILETTTAMLRASGYETYPVRTSEDAMKTLMRHPGIEVVLTDVTLANGDNGVLLARRLANSAWPGAFIFVSGDLEANMQVSDRPARSLFLSKPYGRRDLLQALEAARKIGRTPTHG